MRLMDMDTGAQFCRVDYLIDGRIVFHIPSDMPLPKDIMVMNGKGSGEYGVLVSLKDRSDVSQVED